MSKAWAFWISFCTAQALYAIIIMLSLPQIVASAGGLTAFDMRPFGYDFADARAFLQALSDEGQVFYLTTHRRLDTAYPAALALMFALGFGQMFRGWTLRGLLVLALGVACFDWLENAAVAQMLRAGVAGIDPQMVAAASLWSQLKSGCTTLAYVALLFGGARLARDILKGRPA